MKKKLLLFVVLSVMAAQVTFAQVDMSLFDKDQIWLFAGEKYGSEHCDGIVLSKDSLIYEYEDANYSKYSHQSKLPDYKQPKAVYDYNTLFFSTYKIDKKKYLLDVPVFQIFGGYIRLVYLINKHKII